MNCILFAEWGIRREDIRPKFTTNRTPASVLDDGFRGNFELAPLRCLPTENTEIENIPCSLRLRVRKI